jgi:hypothetical protein
MKKGSEQFFSNNCFRKIALTPFLWVALGAMAAYDVNDLTLGASESQIKQHFPNVNCRALEWSSRAADRRCDDSRIRFGPIDASVTFYLKRDALEGFDVRFDRRELARVKEFAVGRYGKPAREVETPPTVEWKSDGEHARLAGEANRRRASLLVWRGAFEEELYKVR